MTNEMKKALSIACLGLLAFSVVLELWFHGANNITNGWFVFIHAVTIIIFGTIGLNTLLDIIRD